VRAECAAGNKYADLGNKYAVVRACTFRAFEYLVGECVFSTVDAELEKADRQVKPQRRQRSPARLARYSLASRDPDVPASLATCAAKSRKSGKRWNNRVDALRESRAKLRDRGDATIGERSRYAYLTDLTENRDPRRTVTRIVAPDALAAPRSALRGTVTRARMRAYTGKPAGNLCNRWHRRGTGCRQYSFVQFARRSIRRRHSGKDNRAANGTGLNRTSIPVGLSAHRVTRTIGGLVTADGRGARIDRRGRLDGISMMR
jgi:hypothetical protein